MAFWRTGFRLAFTAIFSATFLGALPSLAQDSRVWVMRTESFPGPSARIETPLPEEPFIFGKPFVFEPVAICEDSFDEVSVILTVLDDAGAALHSGALTRVLHTGDNPCRFVWEPEALPDGAYVVRIRAQHPFISHIAEERLHLLKISWSSLSEAVETAQQESARALQRSLQIEGDSAAAMRHRATAAITVDASALAQSVAAQGDWPLAMHLAQNAQQTAGEVNQLLDLEAPPEMRETLPRLNPTAIRVAGSALRVDGRPVFPIGVFLDYPTPEAAASLERYGLGFASIAIPPGMPEAAVAELDAFAHAAMKHGIPIAVSASALDLPLDMFRDQDEAFLAFGDDLILDLNSEAARRATGAHVREVASHLAPWDSEIAFSLATAPRFFFGGEDVRLAFSDHMRDIYEDRLVLNRMWRSNLRSFEDIDIWRSNGHLAYQFNWQTFHQGLGERYLDGLLGIAQSAILARSNRPAGTATITFDDGVLQPGESRYGVDHERMAAKLALLACETGQPGTPSDLAMPFPHASLLHALLRSFNPDAPLMNLRREIRVPGLHDASDRRALMRSAIWEDVMAGAGSVAVVPQPGEGTLPLGMDPETLEGLTAAAQELNRLAPIVNALQQAPATTAIVWSLPSRIHNDGTNYLQAVRDSFEGCSYSGRKVRFITEDQIVAGGLDSVEVLVLPRLSAMSQAAFDAVGQYIDDGGAAIRTADPIPFTERGQNLEDLLSSSGNVVFLRGGDASEQYLHAMGAVANRRPLTPVVHAQNAHGYALEGVRTLFAVHEGEGYLYILNMRPEPVRVHLSHGLTEGRDLVQGQDVAFPAEVQPLTPMLLRIEGAADAVKSAVGRSERPDAESSSVPTATVIPVEQEPETRPAPRRSRGR